jgi:hypothetical protein
MPGSLPANPAANKATFAKKLQIYAAMSTAFASWDSNMVACQLAVKPSGCRVSDVARCRSA